jgi:hypothetical protein
MEIGPVDVLVVEFPGNKFSGAIVPALLDLVRAGTVRVLDLLFVYKEADGTVGAVDLTGLGLELDPAFRDLDVNLPAVCSTPTMFDVAGRRTRTEHLGGTDHLGEQLGGPLRLDPARRGREGGGSGPDPERRCDRSSRGCREGQQLAGHQVPVPAALILELMPNSTPSAM